MYESGSCVGPYATSVSRYDSNCEDNSEEGSLSSSNDGNPSISLNKSTSIWRGTPDLTRSNDTSLAGSLRWISLNSVPKCLRSKIQRRATPDKVLVPVRMETRST